MRIHSFSSAKKTFLHLVALAAIGLPALSHDQRNAAPSIKTGDAKPIYFHKEPQDYGAIVPGNHHVFSFHTPVDYQLEKVCKYGAKSESALVDLFFPSLSHRLDGMPAALPAIAAKTETPSVLPGFSPISKDKTACTGFAFIAQNGDHLLGHNDDWLPNHYYVLRTTPKNSADASSYASTAIIARGAEVTPGGYLLLPYCDILTGMNEKGLAIASYCVFEAENDPEGFHQPPYASHRTDLYHFPFMRLLLDQAASVKEALDIFDRFNYIKAANGLGGTLHHQIQIADTKEAVIVNFGGKKIQVTRRSESDHPEWQAIANNYVHNVPESHLRKSWRYNQVFETLRDNRPENDKVAMKLLESAKWDPVKDGGTNTRTQFSVVYNMSKKTISLCFGENYSQTYFVDKIR